MQLSRERKLPENRAAPVAGRPCRLQLGPLARMALATPPGGQSLPWRPSKGVVMKNVTRRDVLAIAATSIFALAPPALADAPAPFSVNEIVDDGNRFFGTLSRGLADLVQEAASRWGLPNVSLLTVFEGDSA